MKLYRVTVDECTADTFLKRVAYYQPVPGLDKVVERLEEYCESWGFGGPPPAEAITAQLKDPKQSLLVGGPQFPGMPEARFTIYPYPKTQPDRSHIVSIVELGGATRLVRAYDVLPKVEQLDVCIAIGLELKRITKGEPFRLGWAGMTLDEAIRTSTSGLIIFTEAGYSLEPTDLARLENLVEYLPSPAEYLSARQDEDDDIDTHDEDNERY